MKTALPLALALLCSSAALAQPPPANPAIHNGSLMDVISNPATNELTVRYVQARPGILFEGAVPGAILAQGHWQGPPPQVFVGVAFVFARGCEAFPYPVRGGIDQTGNLMLEGPAPIVNPYTCQQIGLAWTGNSVLRIEQIRQAVASAAPVGPPPDVAETVVPDAGERFARLGPPCCISSGPPRGYVPGPYYRPRIGPYYRGSVPGPYYAPPRIRSPR